VYTSTFTKLQSLIESWGDPQHYTPEQRETLSALEREFRAAAAEAQRAINRDSVSVRFRLRRSGPGGHYQPYRGKVDFRLS